MLTYPELCGEPNVECTSGRKWHGSGSLYLIASSHASQVPGLASLPPELKLQILSMLPSAREICALSATTTEFNVLVRVPA